MASLAATTRPRPGKLRKVPVTVPCRYSPATARMPKISVNSAARPTWASALLWMAGSCTLAPDCTSPVTPATTRTGPAPSNSHGPRIVLSLRNSLRIIGSTVGLLDGDESDEVGGWSSARCGGQPEAAVMRCRSASGGGQLEEGRLQRVVRAADLAQRTGEAQLTLADDDNVVGGLGDLAEHVAGDHDGPALVGQATQQAAQPGDARRVEAVGWFVEQEHPRVAEQRRGQAEALPHAQGELADPPPRGRGEINLLQYLVHPAAGDLRSLGQNAQVVAGPPPRMEAGRFKQRPHGAPGPVKTAVAGASDQRLARVRPDQAEHHAQRGGLPRPVGPQEAGYLPGRCGERHIPDRVDPAEGLRQAPDLHRRRPARPADAAAPGHAIAHLRHATLRSI